MAERSELMFRLTRTLAHLAPQEPLPLRLCLAFVRIAGGGDGAIVIGVSLSERTLLCATGEAAARFEDAQDLVHEGPSLDAFRTAEPVVSLSGEDRRRRWPQLAAATASFPVGAVHAIPIQPGPSVMGVFALHQGSGAATSLTMPEMQFLTDAVGTAILGDLPSPEGESRLWTERDQVSQATGMVVAQLGLDPADALALLRAHAFAHEASVVEVCRWVLQRDLDFSRPDREGPR